MPHDIYLYVGSKVWADEDLLMDGAISQLFPVTDSIQDPI